MSEMDRIGKVNSELYERSPSEPWLYLDANILRRYAAGSIEKLRGPYLDIYPSEILRDVSGKSVLCLASGGGQQSAAFSLLGARVTVLDLCESQLAGDRRAADHYGYSMQTVRGDMRDLSVLGDQAFDLVYQAVSICLVPDTAEVYSQVFSVLKPGGLYRVSHCNPATYCVESESWDGEGYRISEAYVGGQFEEDKDWTGGMEFRHLFADIFTKLVECGFQLTGVWDAPVHLHHDPEAKPGTMEHMETFVQQYFAIVAKRPE